MRNIRQRACSIALFLAVAIQACAGTRSHAVPDASVGTGAEETAAGASEPAGHVRAKFIHPGIPFTREDLEALKARLDQPPWKSGFDALANDSHSQLSDRMQGPCAQVKRNPNENLHQWRNDMIAVHNLSLMWWFSGKTDYARKSHDILLAWADTQTGFGGGESGLDLGDYVYYYAVGADILRGTWPGWTEADTQAVQKLFLNVYWPASGAVTNAIGPANKGALGMAAGVGIAAFCDDQQKLDHIVSLVRTSASSGLLNILPTGEVGETGRDGGHSYGQWGSLAFVAEVLWKQGIDVYGEMDNRLLAAGEYYARNDLGLNAPYVVYGSIDAIYWKSNPYLGWSAPRRGLALLHGAYVVRKGLSAPYLDRLRRALPIDQSNWMFEKTVDTSTAVPLAPVQFPRVERASTGFTDTEIGQATPAGASSYSNGVWTLNGGGAEIWTHAEDSCHFAYKQVTGDCAIVAKVESVQNADSRAKAGVMIRDSLSSSAGHRAWMGVRPEHTLEYYQHGWSSGGVWGGTNWEKGARGFPLSTSYWLKIERVGTVISLYASADGASWAAVGAGEYADMPANAYLGLVVCSMANGTPCTATFSNVSITGGNGVPPDRRAGGTAQSLRLGRFCSGSPALARRRRRHKLQGQTIHDQRWSLHHDHCGSRKQLHGRRRHQRNDLLLRRFRHELRWRERQLPARCSDPCEPDGERRLRRQSLGLCGVRQRRQAFDGDSGTKWFAGENAGVGAIQYDLGAGRATVIKHYSITSANDVPERDPKDWQFECSNDAKTWVTLDEETQSSSR